MSKKKGGSAVQIYARVRKLMPWEPNKVSVEIIDQTTVQNKTDKRTSRYTFSHIFNMTKTNEDIYRVMGKPLVRKVLEGFNAVLIAYGQTGSGKTHTLVGKPEQGVKGVLPFMLEELYNEDSVKQLSISGCEAYGTHVSRIECFDLFTAANKETDWTKKKGSSGLEPKETKSIKVTDLSVCWTGINQAHDASHFAPTGKNPESSRGHTAFCTKIEQEDAKTGNQLISYLVVVDLAGSEGESAFTPAFVKKVDPPTLMARRLEAGCINTGLSQLQVVFNELKVKGKLSKSRGTGLRRILHAFINKNCMISVMFTLSPAMNNRVTTESTLKFAVQAGMVKVKPVKQKQQVNFKVLVKELQVHVKEQTETINKLNDDIELLNDKNGDLELKVTRLSAQLEAAASKVNSGGGGGGDNKKQQKNDNDDDNAIKTISFHLTDEENNKIEQKVEKQKNLKIMQKKMFKRQTSRMNDNLKSLVDVFNDSVKNNDNDVDDDGYRELNLEEMKSCVATNISEAKVDNDIKRIHTIRKSVGIDMTMLNASIMRSTTLSKLKLAPLDENDTKNDDIINKKKSTMDTPKTTFNVDFSDIGNDNDIPDDDPDNIPSFSDIEMRQNTFKASLSNQTNRFDAANDASANMNSDAQFLTFNVVDTSGMSKEEIMEYCDELESKLIEERTLRFGLQQAQQVIIDHLMETNEALLQWFKVKKIL